MQDGKIDIKKALEIGINLEQTTDVQIAKDYYKKLIESYGLYKNQNMIDFFYGEEKYNNINTWAVALSYIKVCDVLKELYQKIYECRNERIASKATSESSKLFKEFIDFLKQKNKEVSIKDIELFNRAIKVLKGNVLIEINANGRTLLDKVKNIRK